MFTKHNYECCYATLMMEERRQRYLEREREERGNAELHSIEILEWIARLGGGGGGGEWLNQVAAGERESNFVKPLV